jgi:hypothetical protein
VIAAAGDGPDRGEVVPGLGATVQSALLGVGLIGWTVPAVALGIPGILVVVVVALQVLGGAAWLPVARRTLSRTASLPRSNALRGGRRGPSH